MQLSPLTRRGVPSAAQSRTAYRVWSAAGAFSEPLAFETYESALDREERAATTYASLMSRVGHLTETRPEHQMALTQALPEAW